MVERTESGRIPAWFEIKGKIAHSLRRIGGKLPGWIGDESNGIEETQIGEVINRF